MTNFNEKNYSYNNLSEEDKQEINVIEQTKKAILNNRIIEDFILEKKILGNMSKCLTRELLNEFVEFLKERVEYYKVDIIIDKTDT